MNAGELPEQFLRAPETAQSEHRFFKALGIRALERMTGNEMDFGSGGASEAKAWKDIWGAGQGVGSIHDIPSVNELVLRMEKEYHEALNRLSSA